MNKKNEQFKFKPNPKEYLEGIPIWCQCPAENLVGKIFSKEMINFFYDFDTVINLWASNLKLIGNK